MHNAQKAARTADVFSAADESLLLARAGGFPFISCDNLPPHLAAPPSAPSSRAPVDAMTSPVRGALTHDSWCTFPSGGGFLVPAKGDTELPRLLFPAHSATIAWPNIAHSRVSQL